MKTRVTALIVAIASLVNATNAFAYERACGYGTLPPSSGETAGLDPTMWHLAYLYPMELAWAYSWTSNLNLVPLTMWDYASCGVSGTLPWTDVYGTPAGSTGNFWSYLNGLRPGCGGAEYGFQLVAIFNVSYEFWYTDPLDPFQVPIHHTYNGLWPSEGIPCPQGVVRGILG